MATIEPRDGGTFRARVRRNGAPQLTRTFDTRHDAERWAAETEAAIRGGRLREHLSKAWTLAKLLGLYKVTVTPRKKGAQKEKARIKRLAQDDLGAYSLENLGRAQIRAFRDRRLGEGVSGSTINRELSLISVVLAWGRNERDLACDPDAVRGLKRPENAPRTRRVEGDELERLLAAAEPWLADYIVLAIETGMRRGELAALEWDRVDLKRRVATLLDTKNGSSRRVPLSSRAVTVLAKMVRPIEGGRLFPQHADNISKAFIAAKKAAGVEGLRLHDLRAECVSRLFERGLDLNSVKAISGHKSAIFLRYARAGDAEELALKLG